MTERISVELGKNVERSLKTHRLRTKLFYNFEKMESGTKSSK